ncbi:response regulator transcription factor [Parapedobacter sp. SGR-10]|uniref:response regulator transcription factor n=1 Tax=Parapedobacter sp. SGR-10 TaxID=2710879 RepID=UPI0013D70E1E|nr:response regulator [Parapedobacter sp. SGR-10]NGF55112.1 response regulator transcription factor [Parapedobacter sp. SGR-10]
MQTDFETEKSIVLLADDHEDILDFIADDLEGKYEVVKARNGQEALDYVYLHDVDLIVSDIMMPQLNGYEFCTKLKENEKYCHIPFIMLTAKNSLQSKIEGLEYGADAYIEKPFSPNFLEAQISSLLRNRKHVKDHFQRMPSSPLDISGHNKSDQIFLKKLNKLILENMADPALCVDMLADRLYMSRPTLYRKIKVLSDLSPNELINLTRLNKATQLLVDGEHKVYEIADLLGFSTASHFSRNFQKHFGISPKDYAAKHK